jgi:hypothetical protein
LQEIRKKAKLPKIGESDKNEDCQHREVYGKGDTLYLGSVLDLEVYSDMDL